MVYLDKDVLKGELYAIKAILNDIAYKIRNSGLRKDEVDKIAEAILKTHIAVNHLQELIEEVIK